MSATLVAWHVPTSQLLFKAHGKHEAAITCIWADDSKLATGSADRSIILWTVDGVLLRRVCGHSRGIHSLVFGPTCLVSASNDTVYVWDMKLTDNNFQEVLFITQGSPCMYL